jgi:hypothetical protein
MKRSFPTLLVALFVLAACGGAEKKTEAPAAPQPPPDSIQALMLTYETVLSPDGRTARFHVASDGTFVRLGNETETWRLFDTKSRTITHVDQTAGTATEVTFEEAIAERTRELAAAPTEGAPTASIVEGPGEPERGHETHRVHIKVGAFSREIVLSKEVLLPGEFFAMKVVTDPVDPRYAAILKDITPVLLRQNGTLLSEMNRLELPEGEPVTATTRLVSVSTVPLSRQAFTVPSTITATKKGGDAASEAPER